jgi:hypothetical protein
MGSRVVVIATSYKDAHLISGWEPKAAIPELQRFVGEVPEDDRPLS